MANLSIGTNIVYWKIYLNKQDISSTLARYVNSIHIRNGIVPKIKQSKDKWKNSPNNAEISITSGNYIENLFLEGNSISIWFGYNPFQLSCVFRGIIPALPDGDAKEMLNYTVKAVGEDVVLALYWKARTFMGQTKLQIVQEVMMEYPFETYISVRDFNPLKMKHRPVQREETDMDFLKRLADAWGCVMWMEWGTPNKFYFISAEDAHYYKYGFDYILGYRTDKVPCNVESVEWRHKAEMGFADGEMGVTGYNESGEITSPKQFSKMWVDKSTGRMAVWELNADLYLKATKGTAEEKKDFWKLVKIVGDLKSNNNSYEALKRYYHIVSYADGGTKDSPPAHGNSGFEITVRLNEGDIDLKAPRNAQLWCGSLNPRADSAQLPNWMYRYSGLAPKHIKLKINEVDLVYEGGRLVNTLSCTMGMFQ